MWILLVAPVAIIAVVTAIGLWRRPPPLKGFDPAGLRSVVTWRDPPEVAGDVAGDAQEQLRQLVGALAGRRFILTSSIDHAAGAAREPFARVDVRDRRFELRVRLWRGGGWLLWIDQRGGAPDDSDDLRQLLTGLVRVLGERGVEAIGWHRREELDRAKAAPSPFYVE